MSDKPDKTSEREGAVEFEALQTCDTNWDPAACQVTLTCVFEARAVPSLSSHSGYRTDEAQLVVLDNFFGEEERLGLLGSLTIHKPRESPPESSANAKALPATNADESSVAQSSGDPAPINEERQSGGGHLSGSAQEPNSMLWERNTADDAKANKTWGLKPAILEGLSRLPSQAMLEIQSRLVALYPDFDIAHLPSQAIQADLSTDKASYRVVPGKEKQHSTVGNEKNCLAPLRLEPKEEQEESRGQGDCCKLLANAPVHGDHYEYHADADPMTFPESAWRREFGDYSNREAGMPWLVSLLLYIVDDDWDVNWHGETIFLDSFADVGICVRPRKYRAVLMDQDIYHRVVAPSRLAQQPRYSLVWKLVFLPKFDNQICSLSRPHWGRPTKFASAANISLPRGELSQTKRQRT